MTRILLPIFLLLASAPAAAAERRYTVTDFDRVQVEGPFEVSLKTGGASSAVATGGSDALERLSIEVQGRTLRIRHNRSAWGGYPGQSAGPVRVQLTTAQLRSASVAGSGSLSVDKAKTMRLDLALAGSGRIGVESVEADILGLNLLGAGKMSLGGKAKSLRATVQGSGNLEGDRLTAEDANIIADTAGLIGVGVRRAVTVTSTGQGDTHILGSPACNVKQTGSGQVFCGKSDQGQR